MKFFSREQIKKAEDETIQKQGISSLELMERAGKAVFTEIEKFLKASPVPVRIFCGIGNNGGDGLVIARLLFENGYDVKVYIVNYSEKRSENFVENYQRFIELNKQWPESISEGDPFPEIDKNDFIVDAVFGIGLNRKLKLWVSDLFENINRSEAFVLSIDMPSGLQMNKVPDEEEKIIKANLTFTFQVPKLVFFLPETAKFAGKFYILDIGLDKEFLRNTPVEASLIKKGDARKLKRSREKFSHKGTFGHALLIGGSYGKVGSIALAATSCLRSGVGMLSVVVPECGYTVLQTHLPEAMVIPDENEKFLRKIEFDFDPASIGFGIGAGKDPETKNAFEDLLKKVKKPMVIDADGLNILSENKDLLKFIPENSILTPHPKELERLIGKWNDDFEKIKMAKDFVQKYKLNLIIKGAHSIVVTSNHFYINTTGNPGMATAGSGDVLAGVITGLLSQGYPATDAAIFGVYLHGKAGDLAAQHLGEEALLAGDISDYLGAAFLDLLPQKQ